MISLYNTPALSPEKVQALSQVGLSRYMTWVLTYLDKASESANSPFGRWMAEKLWPELSNWAIFVQLNPHRVGEGRRMVRRALMHLEFDGEKAERDDLRAMVYNALVILHSGLKEMASVSEFSVQYDVFAEVAASSMVGVPPKARRPEERSRVVNQYYCKMVNDYDKKTKPAYVTAV